jgi:chemotaxis protein methyltransferase WspC
MALARRQSSAVNTSVCAALLKETMGLDAAAIGLSAIEHAVQRRMAACSQPDARAYERHLLGSELELQALIEAAVVPETWFFRDGQAFVEMVRALEATSRRAGSLPLRLLSLPCSTGEEPYSMAMTLFDAGFAAKDFRIDAIDISARVLAFAGREMSSCRKRRGRELAFRDRHFEPTEAGHRLSQAVRDTVRFAQGNVFAAGFLPAVGLYDIIFCRNLLVYFDQAAQARAVETLRRLLRDTGTVFVGPAEAGMMFNHSFVWTKVPLAFAFTKKSEVAAMQPEAARPLRRRERRAPVLGPAPVPRLAARAAPAPHAVDLADATRLADAGRFSEAAKLCREHLRVHGSSVPAFYLMGLLSDAAGDTASAIEYFKKALYLDAKHSGSLAHLALLFEKRGDVDGARLLRERLQRQQRDLGALR